MSCVHTAHPVPQHLADPHKHLRGEGAIIEDARGRAAAPARDPARLPSIPTRNAPGAHFGSAFTTAMEPPPAAPACCESSFQQSHQCGILSASRPHTTPANTRRRHHFPPDWQQPHTRQHPPAYGLAFSARRRGCSAGGGGRERVPTLAPHSAVGGGNSQRITNSLPQPLCQPWEAMGARQTSHWVLALHSMPPLAVPPSRQQRGCPLQPPVPDSAHHTPLRPPCCPLAPAACTGACPNQVQRVPGPPDQLHGGVLRPHCPCAAALLPLRQDHNMPIPDDLVQVQLLLLPRRDVHSAAHRCTWWREVEGGV